MSKYDHLAAHLAGMNADHWSASFTEIEEILGFPLPKSAYAYPPWWANQVGGGHSHCASWMQAGWKTENLSLTKKQITFVRTGATRQFQQRTQNPERTSAKLTIAQAKSALAENYGVPPDNIEIIIRG